MKKETLRGIIAAHADVSESAMNAIMDELELDEEWAIAHYDREGRLVEVTHHDYEPTAVLLAFRMTEEKAKDIPAHGDSRLVSRLFTRWSKA
jgi:ribonuclease HI